MPSIFCFIPDIICGPSETILDISPYDIKLNFSKKILATAIDTAPPPLKTKLNTEAAF